MLSEKKPVPLAFTLSWGLAYSIYVSVKAWYGLPVKSITAWDLLLFNDIPFSVILILVAYSFYYSPAHRPLKTFLLVLYGFEVFLIVLHFPEYLGHNSTEWTLSMEHWPREKYLWRVIGEGFWSMIQGLVVGLSFCWKTPFFFDYPPVNPLQRILMNLTGIFCIFQSLLFFVIHLLVAHHLGFL